MYEHRVAMMWQLNVGENPIKEYIDSVKYSHAAHYKLYYIIFSQDLNIKVT